VDERSIITTAMAALPLGTLQRNDGLAVAAQRWRCNAEQRCWSSLRDASQASCVALVGLAAAIRNATTLRRVAIGNAATLRHYGRLQRRSAAAGCNVTVLR